MSDIPEQERCVSCGQVFQIDVLRATVWEPHAMNFCPACGARQPVAVVWR